MAGFVFNAAVPPPQKPPDYGNQTTNKQRISFRDILTEGQEMHQPKDRVDLIEKGLMKVTLEEGNRLLPKVTMDEKLFQDLCNPWKEALVVKLLGKTVGYNLMKDRLKKLWRPSGGFEILDVDNGFYMVKCELLADREKIMSDGPWMLFDHYLAVARWTPDFASPHTKIEKTLVWIRFPGLNLVYYDESVLLGLASVLGTPIKVDTNTLKVERGRFARICVEIDLTLPVVGKVNVNGHWYNVQYEGLHIICGSCGCYGHHTRDCKATPVQQPPANQTVVNHDEQPASNNGRKEPPSAPDREGAKSVGEKFGIINTTHGEWLVVQRKKNNKSNKSKSSNGPLSSLGNKLPNLGGKGKGKQFSPTLKGTNQNRRSAVGPSQLNLNPKKRRIERSVANDNHQTGNAWQPRTTDKSTNASFRRVNGESNKIIGPGTNTTQENPNPTILTMNTPLIKQKNAAQEGDISSTASLFKQQYAPESNIEVQIMDESKSQEEENIPQSPIDWERTE
jgi:hypothetical protein